MAWKFRPGLIGVDVRMCVKEAMARGIRTVRIARRTLSHIINKELIDFSDGTDPLT